MEDSNKLEIAFSTVPMFGHLMPLLPYAAELLRRGHSVTFFHDSNPKHRQKLESCGLGACKSVTYHGGSNFKGWGNAIFDCVQTYYESQATFPDALVYDFFAVDAADAADAMGVPSIGVFPNPRTLNPWAATLGDQASFRWTIWCAFMWALESGFARILWCARSWKRWKRGLPMLPEQDTYPSPFMPRPMIGCTSPLIEFPKLPSAPLFHMVGPALTDNSDPIEPELKAWLETQKGKPIVYVAFGTVFKHTTKSVRKLEADLLALGTEVAVLWSLPKQQQSLMVMQPPPENWKVEAFLPQISLFKSGKIGAFVTHCGSNSVYEAFLSGVPMVCCPAFADQPANAIRLERIGVGVVARKGRVGEALTTLLGNLDQVTETSSKLAKKLNEHCAAKRASDLIEEVANGTGGLTVASGRGRVPLWPLLMICGVLPILYASLAS